MSFASDVKTELCRINVSAKCCALSECYGILLFCNTFSNNGVKIITESRPLAKRLPKLFMRAFGVAFDTITGDDESNSKRVMTITAVESINRILEVYGYEPDGIFAHHINFGILEEDCCRQSFLRGAFFAGGSITDPQKTYHLELVTDHYSVSREALSLLLDMGFEPKSVARAGNFITYFKSSEAIEDFLTTIGAPIAAMEIMSTKIMKDMTNSVNRRVNCDTANVTKTVDAAQEQLEAIRSIDASGILLLIPERLRETAKLRTENPELSLSQLAAIADPPVTKSCLNHRLKKLIEIAKRET